jgi:hypothetical protein
MFRRELGAPPTGFDPGGTLSEAAPARLAE